MDSLSVVEVKAFIPAQDYELSKSFYRDLGFVMASEGDGVAYFYRDTASFLLQNFCEKDPDQPMMMHLLVKDVESWYRYVLNSGVVETYQIKVTPPEDRPWKMRDFLLYDPSGVEWRIGQNI